jgi:RNase adaptor protein for sRNA GlmZ degradation
VDVSQLSEKEITEQLRDLVLFGNYTAKANMFPFQAGVPKDADIVDYKGF